MPTRHSGGIVPAPFGQKAFDSIKIGGGGFVTGLQIANDGTMVCRVDVFGAYIGNTGNISAGWTPLLTLSNAPGFGTLWGFSSGTMNGGFLFSVSTDVYEVVICASNSNVIYMLWLGKMIMSTNQGVSWTIMSGFPAIDFSAGGDVNGTSLRTNQGKMAVDPANANNLIVCTPNNGVYVSNNALSGASATFTNVIAASATRNGYSGACWEPGSTGRAAVSSGGVGVYVSTNTGGSFALSSGSPTAQASDAYFNSGNLFVNCVATSLFMLQSGTWFDLGGSFMAGNGGPQSVKIDPTDATHFAGIGQFGGSMVQGIQSGTTVAWTGPCFTDGILGSVGDSTWQTGAQPPFNPNFLAASGCVFDPNVSQRMFVAYGYGVSYFDLPSKTFNGNLGYVTMSKGIECMVASDIISIPTFAAPLFGVEDQQVFQINPGRLNGPSPTPSIPQIGTRNHNSAAWMTDWSQSNLGVVVSASAGRYVSTNGDYYGISVDAGSSWSKFPTNPLNIWANPGYGDGMITCTDQNHIVFIGEQGGVPLVSTDGGNTWNNSTGVTSATWINGFSFQLNKMLCNDAGGNIYLYHPTAGTYQSTNGGVSFTLVSSDTTICNQTAFATMKALPGNSGVLFITAGGQGNQNYPVGTPFCTSTNGGSTWTHLSNVSDVWTFGFGQAYKGFSSPTLWLFGFVNFNGAGSKCGFWRSRDLGVSDWAYISDWGGGFNGVPQCMSGDMNDYTRMYFGYSGNSFRYGRNIV